jgi:hypothetical protein
MGISGVLWLALRSENEVLISAEDLLIKDILNFSN